MKMTFWKTVGAILAAMGLLFVGTAALSGFYRAATGDVDDFESRVAEEAHSPGQVDFRNVHLAGDELCGDLNRKELVAADYSYSGFKRFIADRFPQEGTVSLQIEPDHGREQDDEQKRFQQRYATCMSEPR